MDCNLFEILSSKSQNTHFIDRYIKFVKSCDRINTHQDGYTEIHHVCPKANDLFPEYDNLEIYKWNSVRLTARQHIIAHVMLWKIFGGSQTYAIDCMLGKFNSDSNIRLENRKVPPSIKIRYEAKIREELSIIKGEARKGKAVFKDENNIKYLLDIDDPKIKELNLVGNNTGNTHSEEAKQKMSIAKYPNKTVKMYFLDCEISVKLFSEIFSDYLAQGWSTEYSQEDMQWVKDRKNKHVSDKLVGRARYCLPDGEYFGMLYKDDPNIITLNLQVQYTESNKKQLESIQQLGAQALIGTNIYNNGTEEARFIDSPDDPQWVKGRLPRSESHSKNQKEAARKAQLGTKAWHNGIVCKRYPDGVNPGDGWVMGLLPRKK